MKRLPQLSSLIVLVIFSPLAFGQTCVESTICVQLQGLPTGSELVLEDPVLHSKTGKEIAQATPVVEGRATISISRDTGRWYHEVRIRVAQSKLEGYKLAAKAVPSFYSDQILELHFGALSQYWAKPHVIQADVLKQSDISEKGIGNLEGLPVRQLVEVSRGLFRAKQLFDLLSDQLAAEPEASQLARYRKRVARAWYELAVPIARQGQHINDTPFQMPRSAVALNLWAQQKDDFPPTEVEAKLGEAIEEAMLQFRSLRFGTLYDVLPGNKKLANRPIEERCANAQLAYDEFEELFKKNKAWQLAYDFSFRSFQADERPLKALQDQIAASCKSAASASTNTN